jgi:hypothetical protein
MLMLFDITSQLLFGTDAWIGFLTVARLGGSSIAFRNATGRTSGTNPAWVRLTTAGEYQLEAKPTTESAETFVSYAVVGNIVGQKTIAQEAS